MRISYPAEAVERDRFVLNRRSPRPRHDPWRHQGLIVDEEPDAGGEIVRAATILLTGRECPWHCVMCDLWRHTIEEDTSAGAIPHQISQAVNELRARPKLFPTHVKLYNAGSFFDPRAVPVADYESIANRLTQFSHVIVESHPALIGERVDRFKEALDRQRSPGVVCAKRPQIPARGEPVEPRAKPLVLRQAQDERCVPERQTHHTGLEVAMGLETAHPDALERLHKRMTLDQFSRAAHGLHARGIALRVFLLVYPPFVPAEEQDAWLLRSVDFAFACGASVVSLIPTRPGNGALDALADAHLFREPRLADLERAFAASLSRAHGRVFADLWDLDRFIDCTDCADARRERLAQMNLSQHASPPIACPRCSSPSS